MSTGRTQETPKPEHIALRALEDALFVRWSAQGQDFNPDGLIDEAEYTKAGVKLLFLMKEVNDPRKTIGQDTVDLRIFLREAPRPQTWNSVALWAEGIHELAVSGQAASWNPVVDRQRRALALRKIAVVNLKKSAGTHTTEAKSLGAAARRDAALLREQLALYGADLTICCGSAVTTAVRANKLLDLGQPKITTRGVRYFAAGRHGFMIDFSHPEARVSPNLLLYGLLDAVAEIKGWGVK